MNELKFGVIFGIKNDFFGLVGVLGEILKFFMAEKNSETNDHILLLFLI